MHACYKEWKDGGRGGKEERVKRTPGKESLSALSILSHKIISGNLV
jgi:hypothetical protein